MYETFCNNFRRNDRRFFADRWFEEEKPDAVIAADAGMEYLYRSHRVPDVIVGDFDSVGTEALAYFKTLPGVAIQKLIPEKDDTDTESAIRLAIRRGAERITLWERRERGWIMCWGTLNCSESG